MSESQNQNDEIIIEDAIEDDSVSYYTGSMMNPSLSEWELPSYLSDHPRAKLNKVEHKVDVSMRLLVEQIVADSKVAEFSRSEFDQLRLFAIGALFDSLNNVLLASELDE